MKPFVIVLITVKTLRDILTCNSIKKGLDSKSSFSNSIFNYRKQKKQGAINNLTNTKSRQTISSRYETIYKKTSFMNDETEN